MRSVTFTENALPVIAHDPYHHPDPLVQRKMEVLWLKHHEETHARIATLAGVSRSSVQRYLTEFLHGGLDEVRRCPYAGPTSALEAPRASLDDSFRVHPPRSVRQAQEIIRQRTGIPRGLTQVRRFLHRLGLEPRKIAAIPVPPKQTAAEHAQRPRRFLDTELEPVRAEARAGRRAVYFVDASHFVFAAILGWLWCAVRWFVRAASGRPRYNVQGALHAVRHRLIRVTKHSSIHAEAVCDLLGAVANAGVARPITRVLDNARYQKCALVQQLAQTLGIQLLYWPSYSANLNRIERVGRFVKKESLGATSHASSESFTASIQWCLGNLETVDKQDMDSLLSHHFQMFDAVPLLAA